MINLNGNRVAVKLDPHGEQKSSGGLYLTAEPPKGVRRGTVKAVGGEYVVGNFLRSSPFKVGQIVMVDELGGQQVKIEGEELLIVRNDDVIGSEQ